MEVTFRNIFLVFGICVVLFNFNDEISTNGNPLIADNGAVNDGYVEDDRIMPPEDEIQKKNRRPDCPMCDTSVYSYCSDKLLHDACCCLNPYETELPRECQYAECTFLHANSCKEHRLITACCCNHYTYIGTA